MTKYSDRLLLFNEHVNLARHIANGFFLHSYDYEDKHQAAFLYLWEITETFDPEKAAFSTYASMKIKDMFNKLIDKKRIRQGRECDTEYDVVAQYQKPYEFPIRQLLAQEYFELIVDDIDKTIVYLKLMGSTIEEIEQQTFMKKSMIHRRYNNAVKRLCDHKTE